MLKEFLTLVLLLAVVVFVGSGEEQYYKAELRKVTIYPQVAYLTLETRDGNLSMTVSPSQGVAIRDALNEASHPRPTTHDLAAELARLSGVKKLVVHDLVNGTYIASLHLGAGVVDIRPSDGIVVCIRDGCPIYVSRELIAGG